MARKKSQTGSNNFDISKFIDVDDESLFASTDAGGLDYVSIPFNKSEIVTGGLDSTISRAIESYLSSKRIPRAEKKKIRAIGKENDSLESKVSKIDSEILSKTEDYHKIVSNLIREKSDLEILTLDESDPYDENLAAVDEESIGSRVARLESNNLFSKLTELEDKRRDLNEQRRELLLSIEDKLDAADSRGKDDLMDVIQLKIDCINEVQDLTKIKITSEDEKAFDDGIQEFQQYIDGSYDPLNSEEDFDEDEEDFDNFVPYAVEQELAPAKSFTPDDFIEPKRNVDDTDYAALMGINTDKINLNKDEFMKEESKNNLYYDEEPIDGGVESYNSENSDVEVAQNKKEEKVFSWDNYYTEEKTEESDEDFLDAIDTSVEESDFSVEGLPVTSQNSESLLEVENSQIENISEDILEGGILGVQNAEDSTTLENSEDEEPQMFSFAWFKNKAKDEEKAAKESESNFEPAVEEHTETFVDAGESHGGNYSIDDEVEENFAEEVDENNSTYSEEVYSDFFGENTDAISNGNEIEEEPNFHVEVETTEENDEHGFGNLLDFDEEPISNYDNFEDNSFGDDLDGQVAIEEDETELLPVDDEIESFEVKQNFNPVEEENVELSEEVNGLAEFVDEVEESMPLRVEDYYDPSSIDDSEYLPVFDKLLANYRNIDREDFGLPPLRINS